MDLTLLKHILYNWGGLAANLLYGFFMVPFVIKHLGNTDYGLWNLIVSVVGYISILDFGIQSSVNRYVAKYRGTGDTGNVNTVYCNAIMVFALLGLLAVLVGSIMSLFLDRVFSISPQTAKELSRVYFLMVVYSALELPFSVYGSILYAYQRFDLINMINAGALLLQSILLVVFLGGGGSLHTFCYLVLAVGVAKYAVNFHCAHRMVPELRFSCRTCSSGLLRSMLRFSGVTFAAIIASNIIFKTDNVVIGIYLGPEAITMYAIGFTLTEYASQLVGKMSNTLTPRFSDHNSRGESLRQYSLLLSSTRFSILTGIPAGCAIIILGKDFIRLWLGPGYELSYYVMAILMAARMCGFPTAPLYSMLYGIGSHHLALYAGITEAVLNLVLSVMLAKMIGVTGVAWGTFIPMLVCNIFMVLLVFNKLQLDLMQWLKKALFPPALLSASFFSIIFMLCRPLYQVSWMTFSIKVATVVTVYAVLVVSFGITSDERGQLKDLLYSRLKGNVS